MRAKKSIYNVLSSLICLVVQTILLFLVRMIFVRYLNQEYLGIQGLFTNIMAMLSLTELGLGLAISYSLYDPLDKKDYNKVSQIMTLYRKVHLIIGSVVFVLGLCLIPFLDYIIKDYSFGNLYLIFIMYLVNLTLEYFVSYKEMLLTADQKAYKLTSFNLIRIIFMYGAQIFILIYFESFILYILVEIIIFFIRRLVANFYISKLYSNVNFYFKEKLEKIEIINLLTNVKAVFYQKLGFLLVDSTDNIIISSIINISTVGIYGNYLSIVTVFKSLLNTFIVGITSSFGNLVVNNEGNNQFNVYRIINFITFVFTSSVTVAIFHLINPFIDFMFGSEYVLPIAYVVIIVINFYLSCMILPLEVVKNTNGLYHIDRFIPLIQAFVNLIFSIILGIKFGLIGVLLGTTLCYALVASWQRPYIVYKYVFKENLSLYFKDYFKQVSITFIVIVMSIFTLDFVTVSSSILNFIISGFVCLLLSLIVILFIYKSSFEFKYLINFITKGLKHEKNSSN